MPELLPLVYIGEVDLHAGDRCGAYRVAYRHARMGVGGRIYEDGIVGAFGLPDEFDDLALMV